MENMEFYKELINNDKESLIATIPSERIRFDKKTKTKYHDLEIGYHNKVEGLHITLHLGCSEKYEFNIQSISGFKYKGKYHYMEDIRMIEDNEKLKDLSEIIMKKAKLKLMLSQIIPKVREQEFCCICGYNKIKAYHGKDETRYYCATCYEFREVFKR